MSWLDRQIAKVAPGVALKRTLARQKMTAVQSMAHYTGAGRGTRGADFRANTSDAVEAMRHDRARLSFIARDKIRNDPRAVRMLELLVDLLVGKGLKYQITLKEENPEIRADLEARLDAHLKTTAIDADGRHALGGLIALSAATVIGGGEVLIRRRLRRAEDGLQVPLQLQVLEGDFLDHLEDGERAGGAYAVQGVEFNALGQRRAYHLFREHPGGRRVTRLRSAPVPAASVIHAFRSTRPGQVRGVSWFAPVITLLHDLASYQDAQVKRQEIAALFAGVLSSDNDDATVDDALRTLQAGAVFQVGADEKLEFTDPPTVEGYDVFMRTTLATIAGAVGLSYQSVAADYERVSFSGGRMSRLDTDPGVARLQEDLIIGQIATPIGAWVKEAITPLIDLDPAAWGIKWTAQARPIVDPARENPAEAAAVAAGIKSRRQVIRERGGDPTEVEADILAERAWEQEHQIKFGLPDRPSAEAKNTIQKDADT